MQDLFFFKISVKLTNIWTLAMRAQITIHMSGTAFGHFSNRSHDFWNYRVSSSLLASNVKTHLEKRLRTIWLTIEGFFDPQVRNRSRFPNRFTDAHLYTWVERETHCGQDLSLGSENGAVLSALASHRCGLGSIPRPGVTCGLILLVAFFLTPLILLRVFRFFLPPQKPAFQISIRSGHSGQEEPPWKIPTAKSIIIIITIIIIIIIIITIISPDYSHWATMPPTWKPETVTWDNIPRTPWDVYSIDEDSIMVPLLSRVFKDGASRSLKEKLKHINVL